MDSTWSTNLSFEDGGTFNPTFGEVETFQTEMDQTVEITTSDHEKLKNRDKEDQHPIKAITNLSTELNKKMAETNAITNMEIEQLIGG